MKREFLNKFELSEDQVNAIMAEHGKTVNAEKAKVTEFQTQAETLEQQLKDRDKDLKDLQKNAGDNEELKKQFEELQGKYKEDTKHLNEALATTKKTAAIDLALTGFKVDDKEYKPKNADIIKQQLKLDSIELADDGSIKGLEEQLKSLATGEGTSFLFDTAEAEKQPQTPTFTFNGNPTPQQGKTGESVVDSVAARLADIYSK